VTAVGALADGSADRYEHAYRQVLRREAAPCPAGATARSRMASLGAGGLSVTAVGALADGLADRDEHATSSG
jgi:hypothetical protein